MTEEPPAAPSAQHGELATQRTADGFLEMMREKRLAKCRTMDIMGAMEPEQRLGQYQIVGPGTNVVFELDTSY